MVSNRITVSLDEPANEALDSLVEETGSKQSEVVRQALQFYAENLSAAQEGRDVRLEEYHRMLSKGEHVMLDIDFLHAILNYVEDEDGDPPQEFFDHVDSVSEYHAKEYEDRFNDIGELLDWMSLCGFLTVRQSDDTTYHVVFPSRQVRWFMMRFIQKSVVDLPFDIEIEQGVSKVIVSEK
ncbi:MULTISPECIES: ribbon-helix-helix protein, CopG family [Haloferacaceae]|uniref:Ribbon-helix-helix protein, CopG family n=1 Tax=Halorubrum glutamatedens TaxID=2707018 RepID=A0ABD5QRX8_9EURY|nr:ribbon-helix-helix protein, CopG family [Halobellus captivus]